MRVMIVGGAGVFGSLLARQMAAASGYDIIIAGRSESNAAAIVRELPGTSFFKFDRNAPLLADLRFVAPDVVVDAAGPFQESGYGLAKMCIEAHINYLDLADARDFVAGFGSLDALAKERGAIAITGASSTPALTHSVIDHFTSGWRRRDVLFAAISPGNRAPRGISVVEAILSYTGKPIELFTEGREQRHKGWRMLQRLRVPGLGKRHVALCESPDLDLLVSRYQPRVSALFNAGLELPILHFGLWLISFLPFRMTRFAKQFRFVARCLDRFGSDVGGMVVRVAGLDENGHAARMEWALVAAEGLGPNVPVLPCLVLLEKMRKGELSAGAYCAAGHVNYPLIKSHFERLNMNLNNATALMRGKSLFETVLGDSWARMPQTTRKLHAVKPVVIWSGLASIKGAATQTGAFVAKMFGFPEAGDDMPVRVVIEAEGDREYWSRHYPTRTMRSVMTNANAQTQTVEECMGPFRFVLRLDANESGLDMTPVRVKLWGLPFPRWLKPSIAASERTDSAGRHLFDVRVALWPFGQLVHYRGWLAED